MGRDLRAAAQHRQVARQLLEAVGALQAAAPSARSRVRREAEHAPSLQRGLRALTQPPKQRAHRVARHNQPAEVGVHRRHRLTGHQRAGAHPRCRAARGRAEQREQRRDGQRQDRLEHERVGGEKEHGQREPSADRQPLRPSAAGAVGGARFIRDCRVHQPPPHLHRRATTCRRGGLPAHRAALDVHRIACPATSATSATSATYATYATYSSRGRRDRRGERGEHRLARGGDDALREGVRLVCAAPWQRLLRQGTHPEELHKQGQRAAVRRRDGIKERREEGGAPAAAVLVLRGLREGERQLRDQDGAQRLHQLVEAVGRARSGLEPSHEGRHQPKSLDEAALAAAGCGTVSL